MKIYLFTSDFDLIKDLDSLGIDGVLHTYNAYQQNPFINICKNVSSKTNMKHMVAIRPYTISPQYLCTINDTLRDHFGKNLIQINFISGWIKENEKDCGGILGEINDYSDSVDRAKYLIKYIEVLENMDREIPDYYISVTNKFTFELAKKYNSKIIIDYSHFKEFRYDLKDMKTMVVVNLMNQDGSFISHEEIFTYIDLIKSNGIEEIILPTGEEKFLNYVVDFVKKYKYSEIDNNDKN